jgi:hypothetical protein
LVSGFANTLTLGQLDLPTTSDIRRALGVDYVDYCSSAYGYGEAAGAATGLALGGAEYVALRATRVAYVTAVRAIPRAAAARIAAGENAAAVAREAVAARNAAKIAARARTPQPFRGITAIRNKRKYGNPVGPTYEGLVGQNKTSAQIIASAGRNDKVVNTIMLIR